MSRGVRRVVIVTEARLRSIPYFETYRYVEAFEENLTFRFHNYAHPAKG